MKTINKFLQETRQPYLIYVDMDGVLTDWDSAVEKLGHGSSDEIKKRGGDSLLWAIIGKVGTSFWSQMNWTKDGQKLWKNIKSYHPTILSAPTKNPTSITGKNQWIDKNLGKYIKRILVPSKEKKQYAKENSILIDDRIDNVKDWKLSGGIGILHKNTNDTISKLKGIINEF